MFRLKDLVFNIETTTFLKSKKIILDYLNMGNSATTEEMIQYVSTQAEECRDKVPQALLALSREGKVLKKISKEKRAFVWFIK